MPKIKEEMTWVILDMQMTNQRIVSIATGGVAKMQAVPLEKRNVTTDCRTDHRTSLRADVIAALIKGRGHASDTASATS